MRPSKRRRLVAQSLNEELKAPKSFVDEPERIERDQVEIIAALVYAKMRGAVSVREVNPGEIEISNPAGNWGVTLEENRVLLKGFPSTPGLRQHVGKLEEGRRTTSELIRIANNIHKLIENETKRNEKKPPVDFPSTYSDSGEEEVSMEPEMMPAPGTQPETPLEDLPPLEPGMGPGMGGSPDMGMGQPMMGPPMDGGMGQPPMGQPSMGNPPPDTVGGGFGGQPNMGQQQPWALPAQPQQF